MQNSRFAQEGQEIAAQISRRGFHRTAGQALAAIVSVCGLVASLPATGFAAGTDKLMILPTPRPLPAFAFQDEMGRDRTLGDFRGKLVVLNLWATWCPPCVKEMPSLDRLHAKLTPKGGMVLALSQDRTGLAKVAPFLAQHRLDLAPYLDMVNAAGKALAISGLPTTVIIAPDGLEVARLVGGAVWDDAAMVRILERWLPAARA